MAGKKKDTYVKNKKEMNFQSVESMLHFAPPGGR